MAQLLERIFAPFAATPQSIAIDRGPAIELNPHLVMSLGLVLHELATNAAKYGALSAPGGQVRVGWSVQDDNRMLRLTWSESGGPPVSAPASAGYGTKLIQSTIAYSLRGELKQDYASEGFRADILVPLDAVAAAA